MTARDGHELEILHEDDYLLVVDKPAGLLVISAPDRKGAPTALDQLRARYGGSVFAVHRLDEDTTGVLVFARSKESREQLDGMLRRREVERVYLAAVGRVPAPPSGRIESYLTPDRNDVMRSGPKTGRSKKAITIYETLERRDYGALVECRLETGRRNQIRAHMSDIDCPILGDRKYGFRVRQSGARAPAPRRPLLHAARVRFRHPILGGPIEIESVASEVELRSRDFGGGSSRED